MIHVQTLDLSDQTLLKLGAWQQYVDQADSYEAKVKRAKSQFPLANRFGGSVFNEVKQTLSLMCAGARRCMYCEDSVADEVEHHHPKDIYPELTFVWENYLYACGPCNGPKNNKFAVLIEGTVVSVTRKRTDPVLPPVTGQAALIHPRNENPLDLLFLDILGETFRFTAHPLADEISRQRAEYTIDTLGLNKKDYLLVARREAFHSYLARLQRYAIARADPVAPDWLQLQRDAILRMQHPTVFREMVRQAAFIAEMQEAVAAAPEILEW